jgi:cyclic pyranopterin monophosphate synthase
MPVRLAAHTSTPAQPNEASAAVRGFSASEICSSLENRAVNSPASIENAPGMNKLTHIDVRGEARMVDVSAKPVQQRQAVARGEIRLQKPTLRLIETHRVTKGNVLATARVAGIQAAKKTGGLIPMCHPLPISHCDVNFEVPKSQDRIIITASAKISAQTGVEMEALTAVSVAALTIYDMCKAVDKKMRISDVRLVSKTKK